MASGLTEVTRRRAEEVVKALVARGEVAANASERMVDDLLSQVESNRKAIRDLVSQEVQRALKGVEVVSKGTLDALESRLSVLERLRGGEAEEEPATSTAKQTAAKTTAAKATRKTAKKATKTAAKKATRKTSAKKTAAKKTAKKAKKASAKKASAKKASAKKASAKKASAKKSTTAKKTAAKKTAKKASAKKSSARKSDDSSSQS